MTDSCLTTIEETVAQQRVGRTLVCSGRGENAAEAMTRGIGGKTPYPETHIDHSRGRDRGPGTGGGDTRARRPGHDHREDRGRRQDHVPTGRKGEVLRRTTNETSVGASRHEFTIDHDTESQA